MNLNRQIIEEIDRLKIRAQSIALYNLDELGLDPSLSIQDKAIFCLMVAAEERKRNSKQA